VARVETGIRLSAADQPLPEYQGWISSRATAGELNAIGWQIAGFDYLPRISVALVISDADEVWIKSSMDCVLGQEYPHLELCICDNNSQRPHVAEVLERYAAADERVKVRRLPDRESWSSAYNAAISMATGDFVTLLEGGDEFASEALFKVVEVLQHARADVVYTDEDHIDVSGRRSDPVFKPPWSPDLLLSTAYIGRLCVMRRSVLEAAGAFREGFEGAEEHDLILRISEQTDRIRHLPEVLYHRRRLPGTLEKPRLSSGAIEDALIRRGADARVERGMVEGAFRVVWSLEEGLRVSVVVLFPEGLVESPVLSELEQETSYPIHQVLAVNAKHVEHPSVASISHPFPARALNLAAEKSEGEYLVFVDARARITDPGWLQEMLRQARRREVGAVGCKLVNMGGSLRHGGSFTEMAPLIGSPEESVSEGGHYLPLVDHTFNFGAASSECMVMRKAVFHSIGGFDDANLPTSFYDLDLSFRLREIGLKNVYTPYVRVIGSGGRHVPSEGEVRFMWSRWWTELVQSLYYQHSPLHPAYHGLDKEALLVASG
jgi:O-antigen biosynthesis protein